MDLSAAMSVAASGMAAQSERIKIISQNIANADSTATQPGQDPYRRMQVTFKNVYDSTIGANVVKVAAVTPDMSDFRQKYDPTHPAADTNGYVTLPNVNTIVETADLREAQRSYEASLSAMDLVKSVAMTTISGIRG